MCSRDELQSVIQRVVQDTVEMLSDKIDKIVLYGSYARGDFTSESDIDIMILLNCEEQEVQEYRKAVSRLASRILLDNDVEVSLLLRNSRSFEEKLQISSFYQNVQKESIVLYSKMDLHKYPRNR